MSAPRLPTFDLAVQADPEVIAFMAKKQAELEEAKMAAEEARRAEAEKKLAETRRKEQEEERLRKEERERTLATANKAAIEEKRRLDRNAVSGVSDADAKKRAKEVARVQVGRRVFLLLSY